MRAVLAMVAAAALVLVLSAGGGEPDARADATPGHPRRGGKVVIGLAREPVTLNPYIVANGLYDHTLLNTMNDPPLEVRSDGQFHPVLLTRVPTASNGGVVRRGPGMDVLLDIDPRAHWSDGTPIGCTDINFTWRTVMNPHNMIGTRSGFEAISTITCPTRTRAVLHFGQPFSDYLTMLTLPVLPQHVLAGQDFNAAWAHSVPVSSGPFLFERWRHGVSITVRRDPHYWRAGRDGSGPWVDRIEYRFFENGNTLALELSAGDIDLIGRSLETSMHDEQHTFPNAKVVAAPTLSFQGFSFNHDRAPMNDPHVRTAMAYAIDRERLLQVVLGDPFHVLDSTLVPQSGSAYAPLFARYRPDAGKVAANLEAAGYTKGGDGRWTKSSTQLTLTFKTTGGTPSSLQLAQALQQQLVGQGIAVKVVLETPQVFYGATLRTGSWDLVLWGMGVGTNPVQRSMFHCEPSPGRRNAQRYCNRQVSGDLDRALVELDPARRGAIIRRFSRQLAVDLPVLPLYQEMWETVIGPRVHGVLRSSGGGTLGWDAEHWWVDP